MDQSGRVQDLVGCRRRWRNQAPRRPSKHLKSEKKIKIIQKHRIKHFVKQVDNPVIIACMQTHSHAIVYESVHEITQASKQASRQASKQSINESVNQLQVSTDMVHMHE